VPSVSPSKQETALPRGTRVPAPASLERLPKSTLTASLAERGLARPAGAAKPVLAQLLFDALEAEADAADAAAGAGDDDAADLARRVALEESVDASIAALEDPAAVPVPATGGRSGRLTHVEGGVWRDGAGRHVLAADGFASETLDALESYGGPSAERAADAVEAAEGARRLALRREAAADAADAQARRGSRSAFPSSIDDAYDSDDDAYAAPDPDAAAALLDDALPSTGFSFVHGDPSTDSDGWAEGADGEADGDGFGFEAHPSHAGLPPRAPDASEDDEEDAGWRRMPADAPPPPPPLPTPRPAATARAALRAEWAAELASSGRAAVAACDASDDERHARTQRLSEQ
jgi:hypothetical protein